MKVSSRVKQNLVKQTLANGLTVIIKQRSDIPKVSTQLWYGVGSKDEKSGQKGIAHLIEHMIFKGTGTLSECDINLITHKLSGYCNAFTSYDYTGYLFDFPSQHWHEALPIMADCMRNCTFKQEFLNSELKAVIQELKMYRDDYVASVIEYMLSAVFADHPYHHPIIGYKQDLWNLSRQSLVDFYNYHYIPNNASLVVVGDVNPAIVIENAHKYFGNLPANNQYQNEKFYHSPDLRSYSIVTYRDIKQPIVICSWVIPGSTQSKDYLNDILTWIIGSGRSSRLYKKLVNELNLATEVSAFSYDLFDYGMFFLYIQPKEEKDISLILAQIQEEMFKLANEGPTEREIKRAIKKTEVDYLNVLENNQKQAYSIGKYYLATNDENFFDEYTKYPKDNLGTEIQNLVFSYLKPSIMNVGKVLPLSERDKSYWIDLQEISDEEDAKILDKKVRTTEVEEGQCVHSIEVKPTKPFNFAKGQSIYLKNGLKVLYSNDSKLPKVDLVIDFKAKYYYDPENLQGLSAFVFNLLEEGTKNYTADEFAESLELHGMTLYAEPGVIGLSMLSSDFKIGLELLSEILTNALFDVNAIEKVRGQMLARVQQFWDTPMQFTSQLLRESIYRQHPYSKNSVGTKESLESITREDIVQFYKKYISPKAAKMAIVGDVENCNIVNTLEEAFKNWQGTEVSTINWSNIRPIHREEINYHIVRDQVVLAFGGLSVERNHPDYDKLLLFDQIFTGGVLGSMSSKLFDLREKTGLFYTIGGSLIANVDKQPGMIIIKTIVSNNRLDEAENQIEELINTAINTITDNELIEAKGAINNSLVDNFASNYRTAQALLYIDHFNLSADYFDNRSMEIDKITKEEVIEVVNKYLNTDKLIKVRAGRI